MTVIFITGANSGIGKALALLLGGVDVQLGLADVNKPTEVAAAICAAGGEAIAIQCDVRSTEQVNAAVKTVVDKYGLLNGAANVAGVTGAGRNLGTEEGALSTLSDEEWDRVISINLTGLKNCLRAEINHMKAGNTSIVNVASTGGIYGIPFNSAYASSKAAVIALTKSVAGEVVSKGIRVNAIAPGLTHTPMVTSTIEEIRQKHLSRNLLKRAAEPVEIANVIRFLLSEESSFCTQMVYTVDGGRV